MKKLFAMLLVMLLAVMPALAESSINAERYEVDMKLSSVLLPETLEGVIDIQSGDISHFDMLFASGANTVFEAGAEYDATQAAGKIWCMPLLADALGFKMEDVRKLAATINDIQKSLQGMEETQEPENSQEPENNYLSEIFKLLDINPLVDLKPENLQATLQKVLDNLGIKPEEIDYTDLLMGLMTSVNVEMHETPVYEGLNGAQAAEEMVISITPENVTALLNACKSFVEKNKAALGVLNANGEMTEFFDSILQAYVNMEDKTSFSLTLGLDDWGDTLYAIFEIADSQMTLGATYMSGANDEVSSYTINVYAYPKDGDLISIFYGELNLTAGAFNLHVSTGIGGVTTQYDLAGAIVPTDEGINISGSLDIAVDGEAHNLFTFSADVTPNGFDAVLALSDAQVALELAGAVTPTENGINAAAALDITAAGETHNIFTASADILQNGINATLMLMDAQTQFDFTGTVVPTDNGVNMTASLDLTAEGAIVNIFTTEMNIVENGFNARISIASADGPIVIDMDGTVNAVEGGINVTEDLAITIAGETHKGTMTVDTKQIEGGINSVAKVTLDGQEFETFDLTIRQEAPVALDFSGVKVVYPLEMNEEELQNWLAEITGIALY